VPIQDQVGPLRRVYVRAPEPAAAGAWREYGWRKAPDPARAAAEHEAFRATLEDAGAAVVVGTAASRGDPDAIYVADPALLTERGAILLRPGKPGRRGEVELARADLEGAGVPVLGALEEPALAEGGDLFWLDERTLLAGVGYRTNEAGVASLRDLLPDVEVLWFDLPYLSGPSACTHLMSFVSMLDRDLAVVHRPQLPVRLMQLFDARDVRLVDVPDEEVDSMGPNVLALGPRIALAVEGNPETRRAMEAAGVDVRAYAGDDISRAGDGGPTCLTQALARA
jgi:N-dimethylarginine dimethylaminohydrolase